MCEPGKTGSVDAANSEGRTGSGAMCCWRRNCGVKRSGDPDDAKQKAPSKGPFPLESSSIFQHGWNRFPGGRWTPLAQPRTHPSGAIVRHRVCQVNVMCGFRRCGRLPDHASFFLRERTLCRRAIQAIRRARPTGNGQAGGSWPKRSRPVRPKSARFPVRTSARCASVTTVTMAQRKFRIYRRQHTAPA